MTMKPFSKISPADLRRHPVWEFANDVESQTGDETFLRTVDDLPVDDLGNRIVGTMATLANGNRIQIILQNVDLWNAYKTEHFVTLTVFDGSGKEFPLARYHDIMIDRYGPDQLADFLRLTVEDIFPIEYDISEVAIGDPCSVRRKIPAEPRQKLSRSEIIRMAVG